ncbi:hypothetical protein QTN25_002878 [Entamoeba marina]
MNNKKLDSYSLLIVSKYFKSPQDFINVICVCKKFQETTEKLRFNSIPITSLKLFPKIQTQYLYDETDIKIDGIDNYDISYYITYDQYLERKKNNDNFHNVIYTRNNRLKYVKSINDECFSRCSSLQSIVLPSTLTYLGNNCFFDCKSLISFQSLATLKFYGIGCFMNCSSLQSINLQLCSTVNSLRRNCFLNCTSLTKITLPSSIKLLDDYCFSNCSSLPYIEIPTLLTSLNVGCFKNCFSLESINLPYTLTHIGTSCFVNCNKLKDKINVPDKCFFKA